MNFEMNFLLQPLPQQVERPVIESDAAHSRQRSRTVAPHPASDAATSAPNNTTKGTT